MATLLFMSSTWLIGCDQWLIGNNRFIKISKQSALSKSKLAAKKSLTCFKFRFLRRSSSLWAGEQVVKVTNQNPCLYHSQGLDQASTQPLLNRFLVLFQANLAHALALRLQDDLALYKDHQAIRSALLSAL